MAKIKSFETKGKEMRGAIEAVPKDDYLLEIVKSEWKPTKSGQMLALQIKILKGDYANRMIFENLNLENESEEAVRIAQGTLADINRACGFGEKLRKDSEELHNIPFYGKVGITKSDKYGDGNKLLEVWSRKANKGKGKDDDKTSKPPWEEEGKKDKKKGKKNKGKKK